MKVMNRMIISSALLIFLSLVILIFVIAGIIFIPLIINGDPGARDMTEKDSYAVGKAIDFFDISSENWEALNSELSAYNYDLYVIDERGETLFAGTQLHNESIDSLKGIQFMEDVRIGSISQKNLSRTKPMGFRCLP